ncbi:MAG: hypothetical protein K6B28_05705 [Lachnospiraceae bacterium]|nr:hypothetical protein [Lachnospiraceae bacterium]
MKRKFRKKIAPVLSAVLVAVTCVTMIPQLSETVFAEETVKNIQLGAAVLNTNVNTASAPYVYYDDRPDAWRVIGYDGSGVASSQGTLTLIASGVLSSCQFNDGYNNIYIKEVS